MGMKKSQPSRVSLKSPTSEQMQSFWIHNVCFFMFISFLVLIHLLSRSHASLHWKLPVWKDVWKCPRHHPSQWIKCLLPFCRCYPREAREGRRWKQLDCEWISLIIDHFLQVLIFFLRTERRHGPLLRFARSTSQKERNTEVKCLFI